MGSTILWLRGPNRLSLADLSIRLLRLAAYCFSSDNILCPWIKPAQHTAKGAELRKGRDIDVLKLRIDGVQPYCFLILFQPLTIGLSVQDKDPDLSIIQRRGGLYKDGGAIRYLWLHGGP